MFSIPLFIFILTFIFINCQETKLNLFLNNKKNTTFDIKFYEDSSAYGDKTNFNIYSSICYYSTITETIEECSLNDNKHQLMVLIAENEDYLNKVYSSNITNIILIFNNEIIPDSIINTKMKLKDIPLFSLNNTNFNKFIERIQNPLIRRSIYTYINFEYSYGFDAIVFFPAFIIYLTLFISYNIFFITWLYYFKRNDQCRSNPLFSVLKRHLVAIELYLVLITYICYFKYDPGSFPIIVSILTDLYMTAFSMVFDILVITLYWYVILVTSYVCIIFI
jgi:hypothetical protein